MVVDASAVVDLLVGGPRSTSVAGAMVDKSVHAPDLIVLEVLSALRGLERSRRLASSDVDIAVAAFATMPITRWMASPFLIGIWSLRANLTIYDGVYVALARRLACPLLTTDARLSRAPALGIPIILA